MHNNGWTHWHDNDIVIVWHAVCRLALPRMQPDSGTDRMGDTEGKLGMAMQQAAPPP